MFSFKTIVLIAAAFVAGVQSSGVAVPTALAAPLAAPAHVGYAHTIPQNIPPYGAQINVASKALYAPAPFAAPIAAPLAASVAAPLVAPAAAPVPAPFAAPFVGPAPFARLASPFYSGAPVLPGPYPYQTPLAPAAYAGAYAYAAPFFNAPVGVPAFVR